MTIAFGEGELGVIECDSWRYQIRWEDLLWSGRMLEGEAGTSNAASVEGAAVLWCMASLFALRRGTNWISHIQGYSQPINPNWLAEGEFCRPGGVHRRFRINPRSDGTRNYQNDEACSPSRLARRVETQSKTWEQLQEDTKKLVHKWATGRLQNPIPKAVEFAVPKVASESRGAVGLEDRHFTLVWDTLGRDENSISDRGNAFYSNGNSRQWNAQHVKIRLNQNIGTDSNIETVEQVTRPLDTGGERRNDRPAQSTTLQPPANDIFERTSAITSDRTSPPDVQYSYLQVNGEVEDPNAREMLSSRDTELVARNSADRFLQQINAMRLQGNLEMSQMVPIIQIFCEDDAGGVVNLNEIIFSVSPHDRTHSGEFEIFPDRPLASLESFELTVQEPTVGGVTGISMGTLTMKVHNPQMVTREHSVGKYIAYMMSQGFVMRIRYGLEGAYDSSVLDLQQAFQWKEEDFFVTEYRIKINNDKTMNLSVKLMPATHRLLNQIRIGQSIPISDLGTLRANDIRGIVNQVVSSDTDITPAQISELKRRLSSFNSQLNSARESPGVGLEDRGDGTFGSTLHAALTNQEIFSREEGLHSVPVQNMVEALQGVQGVLLTRRFENILAQNCYRATHRETGFNAVNIGPLIHEVVKPEIDYVFGIVSRNQIEIGEKFSVDSHPIDDEKGDRPVSERRNTRPQQRTPRRNIKLVFGNFNSRAGQWSNKPISTFPVNVEAIFSHLREVRDVGQFSSTINAFFGEIRKIIQEDENYDAEVSQGSEAVRFRIEKPSIKYVIYPDLTDESSWVMYVYDDKVPTVRLREVLDSLADRRNERNGRPPSKDDVKRVLKENGIPWIEMGEEGAFIKEFSADTVSDDLLASNNIIAAGRQQRSLRDMDAAESWPAGISRDFVASSQMNPQQRIRQISYVAPIRVSATSLVLPTAYYMAPIFVFFPVRTFSGVYIISEVRHDIKAQGAITNLNLIINVSVYNQIPL